MIVAMTAPSAASAPRRKPAHTARRVTAVLSATAFAGLGTALAVAHHDAGGSASPVPIATGSSGAGAPSGGSDQFDGFDAPQSDGQFVPPQPNGQVDPFAGQGATPAPFQPAAPPLTNSGGS